MPEVMRPKLPNESIEEYSNYEKQFIQEYGDWNFDSKNESEGE